MQKVGASQLRRLSRSELQATLQDLFQLPDPPNVDALPADNDRDGFSTFSDVQTFSAQHLRAYAQTARSLADGMLTDPARRGSVLGCDAGKSGCLSSFIGRFGRLAYRRRLQSDEVERLSQRAVADALDASDQVRYAIQALLISPEFLYRLEIGDHTEGLSTLSQTELATRLSFALWGRGPSAELLDEAEQGALRTPEGLRAAALRMLEDPRAARARTGFFREWLGYKTLRAPNVKPADWSDAILPQLQQETDQVLATYAAGSDDIMAALTANETRLTPELAKFYGLPAPGADGRVQLPVDHPRANAGILGHASVLSMKGDGDMVAVRGNWLRRTFFCSTLHIPSEIASELGDLLVGLTRVQIVKKRNTESACKGCHAVIDPIGVGLVQFDATGRFDESVDRDVYGISPALPDLDDAPFTSLAELSSALRASPAVAQCLTEKVFTYMNGRLPGSDDACALKLATDEAALQNRSLPSLLGALVAAPAFRLRQVEEAP